MSSHQSVEWSVLESIHPTICVSNENAIVSLLVPVELGKLTDVHVFTVPHDTYLSSASFSVPADAPSHSASLSVLPPLRLRVALPPTYPSHDPPIIQSLQAAASWLPPLTLALVEERLTAMWSPGDDSGVLYNWVEWIRTGDFLADIGLLADDMHSIRLAHPTPHLLLTPLLAYASSSRSDEFARASYPCTICLSQRKGVHCLALSCGHIFCRACLVDMWGLHVKEGQVSQVSCPEPKCGQTDKGEVDGLREATEDEVRAILSETEVDRWKWLRRKRDFERDPTTVHCPMEYCQEPVPKPKSDASTGDDPDLDDSAWTRLRTCTACGYAFCVFCRRTWHGPHTHCPLPLSSKFIFDYFSAPPDSAERRAMERRYGRSNVLRLARQHEEDQANKKWMDSSTMACPGCKIRVEKSTGCNHESQLDMTCAKCRTHFCYRCGSKIPPANPYQHFLTPHTPCFSKLFDLVPAAGDEWQPVEGFEVI